MWWMPKGGHDRGGGIPSERPCRYGTQDKPLTWACARCSLPRGPPAGTGKSAEKGAGRHSRRHHGPSTRSARAVKQATHMGPPGPGRSQARSTPRSVPPGPSRRRTRGRAAGSHTKPCRSPSVRPCGHRRDRTGGKTTGAEPTSLDTPGRKTPRHAARRPVDLHPRHRQGHQHRHRTLGRLTLQSYRLGWPDSAVQIGPEPAYSPRARSMPGPVTCQKPNRPFFRTVSPAARSSSNGSPGWRCQNLSLVGVRSKQSP